MFKSLCDGVSSFFIGVKETIVSGWEKIKSFLCEVFNIKTKEEEIEVVFGNEASSESKVEEVKIEEKVTGYKRFIKPEYILRGVRVNNNSVEEFKNILNNISNQEELKNVILSKRNEISTKADEIYLDVIYAGKTATKFRKIVEVLNSYNEQLGLDYFDVSFREFNNFSDEKQDVIFLDKVFLQDIKSQFKDNVSYEVAVSKLNYVTTFRKDYIERVVKEESNKEIVLVETISYLENIISSFENAEEVTVSEETDVKNEGKKPEFKNEKVSNQVFSNTEVELEVKTE